MQRDLPFQILFIAAQIMDLGCSEIHVSMHGRCRPYSDGNMDITNWARNLEEDGIGFLYHIPKKVVGLAHHDQKLVGWLTFLVSAHSPPCVITINTSPAGPDVICVIYVKPMLRAELARQIIEESSVQGIGGFITFSISIDTRPLSQDMERQRKSLLEEYCRLDVPFTNTANKVQWESDLHRTDAYSPLTSSNNKGNKTTFVHSTYDSKLGSPNISSCLKAALEIRKSSSVVFRPSSPPYFSIVQQCVIAIGF